MGTGYAAGDHKALEAAKQAICSPLLEDTSIAGATGILINITGGPDLTLTEINEAAMLIQEAAHEDANIIFGTVIDESMGDTVRVTVIATGIGVMETKRAIRRVVGGADVDISTMDHVDITPYRRSVGAEATDARRPERRRFAAADAVDLDVPTFLRRQAD
jgi:cell division protein FtsZ